MEIQLTTEEREFVKQAGTARYEANKWWGDIADYDKSRFDLTSLQTNRIGVFAEAAVFKAFGGDVLDHTLEEWAHYVPNTHENYKQLVKKNADLWNNVEVRRAHKQGNPLPIRGKDKRENGLVVQAFVPYRLVQKPDKSFAMTVGLTALVTGWAWATDEGEVPSWSVTGDAVVVTPRPMNTFDAGLIER